MANWWDKNLTDKQKFRLQDPQDASLLDVVSAVPTPVGDVASGLLAAKDVSKGNYGMAALNALGLLPFIPSMGAVIKNSDTFEQLAKTGKMRQAKNKEQELNDLISGKSKFAEVRLNWDDPKTYDLADKLKAQGFDSTVTQQGKDTVTLFHKSAEDVSPVLNAKTPYDFGKAYGYTDNDIAAFYNNRYGKDAEKYWKQDSKFLPAKTEFEIKQLTAQKNATLPISEGGLGLPATNTAMDRAKALGFDIENPLYHGTKSDFNAFKEGRRSTYLTDEPRIADIYANSRNNEFYNANAEPNVIPVFTKNNMLNVSDLKNGEHGWMHDNLAELLNMPVQRGLYKEAEKKGYDVVKVNNMTDLGGEQTQYIVPTPSNIRSRFAAFDPFRRNEADILAGVGVGLPVSSGLLDIENKKETKKEKKKN